MESLPLDISLKLERLPVISVNDEENIQKILISDDFNDIYTYYENHFMPDDWKSQQEIYKRLSLYLTITNQDNDLTSQLDSLLYRRPVPTISEFLSDKFYMYNSNATLYPYWRQQLEYMFREGSPIRKTIFGGSIGCLTGDTVVATLNGNKTIYELLNNYDNEWVLSFNTSNKTWEPDKIINVFCSGIKDVYKITLDNNEVVKCTSDHRFLTRKNKWKSIDTGLKSNESMMPYYSKISDKGYNHKIISIEYIGKQQVYDITTEKNHNFALNAGIIAHNCGKSTIARKAFLYVLYRILCLRYPRAVFNIDSDATIANIIISMTLKQVYETNLLPFIKLMETMPCFQKVMNMRSFENFDLSNPKCPIPFTVERSTGTIYFPDNIIIGCGSGITHTIGLNIVNSFCDEINEKGVQEALDLLNSVDNRFSSRFQGSPLVFQSVVSSARTVNSPIGEYIKRLPKNDPSILVLNPRLWEVKEDPEFLGDGTTFPILVGNGSIPSKIFTDPGELKALEDGNYEPPAGCEVLNVPAVYRSKFELQLEQSIQDIAGMTTSDNNMVFRDTSKLEDENLMSEIELEVNIKDNVRILDLLNQYNLWTQDINGKYLFKRAPNALRFCHVDLAGSGSDGQCDAAVCIGHKEWQQNNETLQKEDVYIIDLLLFITAKNKVDIHAIQQFLIDLVTERDMIIDTVTSDQWNGLVFLQGLEMSGCFREVKQLSVDAKPEPYRNAAILIEKGLVKIGNCPKLRRELEALTYVKGKVTRTVELKDGADVLCGFLYDAQLNYIDIPRYEYTKKASTAIKDITYTDLLDEKESLYNLF